LRDVQVERQVPPCGDGHQIKHALGVEIRLVEAQLLDLNVGELLVEALGVEVSALEEQRVRKE
jgi:hypothetical protein